MVMPGTPVLGMLTGAKRAHPRSARNTLEVATRWITLTGP
jgi:hypothetical protein